MSINNESSSTTRIILRSIADWRLFFGMGCIVLGFSPWNIWQLILIGFAPLYAYFGESQSRKESIVRGLLASTIHTVGGFFWIPHSIHNFGGLPYPVALMGLLLYAPFAQLQFTAFSIFLFYAKSWKRIPLWILPIFLGLVYAGLDQLTPKVFFDSLGHHFYFAKGIRQAASFGGIQILTFSIVSFNIALYILITGIRGQDRPFKIAKRFLPTVSIFIFLYGAGLKVEHELERLIETPQSFIRAGVIQGNIGDFEKVAAESGVSRAAQKVLDTFFKLSDEAISKDPELDFILWPETTYPSTFRKPSSNTALQFDIQVETYVRDRKVPLIFGGYDTNKSTGKDYNSLFILYPDRQKFGTDIQIYHKSILLPFGEYIPIIDRFESIRKLFPQMGFFGRGPGPQVLNFQTKDKQEIPLSPIICYEALFSKYVADAARMGSKLILNVTNDSWFGKFGEPYQHLALTTFRSIETRLPQIRSTNTGVTTLILPTGEIYRPTPVFETKVEIYKIPINDRPDPPIVSIGAWFNWLAPAFAIGVCLFPIYSSRRKRFSPGSAKT